MKKYKTAFYIFLCAVAVILSTLYFFSLDIAVLHPKGMIAHREKDLIHTSSLLMLIVVIPVLVLTAIIAMKYKASNKAKYTPEWDHSHIAEAIWWGVPCLIILVLGVLTWKSSHALDPFKPIDSDKKPVTIQVVALQWKWLFIYPEENIATVNYIEIPEKTPINFTITADAPMNSFWVPELGGQVYAMPGMKTKLHLIADEMGSFRGSSANLSGTGFSGMQFIVKASSDQQFLQWLDSARSSPNTLTLNEYKKLSLPSENTPPTFYRLEADDLYEKIVMKYMMPMPEMENIRK